MDESNVEDLLREMRDLQREHLEENRRLHQRIESLEQVVTREGGYRESFRWVLFGALAALVLPLAVLFILNWLTER